MISTSLQSDAHQLIIYDLAIRTLNYDLPKIEALKTSVIFQEVSEKMLKELYQNYYPLKNRLQKQGIAIVKWQHIDLFFSDVILKTSGEDVSIRYAKKVLQYDVERLIRQQLMKLEYRG
ncbi:MAG: aconitate hydratase [Kurthia sp.]|nr:aconitate hydratase [Candidatus Kurthia equi]